MVLPSAADLEDQQPFIRKYLIIATFIIRTQMLNVIRPFIYTDSSSFTNTIKVMMIDKTQSFAKSSSKPNRAFLQVDQLHQQKEHRQVFIWPNQTLLRR